MQDLQTIFQPPLWLIHGAIAAVWLYEGLWCKLLGREAFGEPNQGWLG